MSAHVLSDRVFNFSAGPAVLPLPVLEQAQRDLLALPGVGCSILEISHRSSTFIEIMQSAENSLRELLSVPDNYRIVFLQGGARLQFSMVPMNLLRGTGRMADYVLTGSWGKKACDEATREGQINIAWDGKQTNYDRLPEVDELRISPDSAYLHITSNETIQGVQFQTEPDLGVVPMVCDASSDFLSRPIDIRRYGLVYACAQKNAGPAGVTVVIIRDDLLQRSQPELPGYLNFRRHVEENSLYNTPPTFAIYLLGLITRWLLDEVGGLEQMDRRNRDKAAMLYDVIDQSDGFYRGHASPRARSMMNAVFRLPDEESESRFVTQASHHGLSSLKGHRSVGGIRASIYNAMPVEGAEALRDFMLDFKEQNA